VRVVGDLMLDDYIDGEVERVSPEAPVPVVRARSSFQRLGGAGNVANACAAFGAKVGLCGVLGSDAFGDAFLAECAAAGIDTGGIVRTDDRPTTRKLRVLSRQQQILRLDWEERGALDEGLTGEVVGRLEGGRRPDVLILSDYAKGLLGPETLATLIRWAREHQVPVLVDPKSNDVARYRGATLLTPNLPELAAAVGRPLAEVDRDTLIDAAREVQRTSAVETLCVTLGARGMLILDREGSAEAIAAASREVYDVTGAGDTVLAVLALCLAAGAELPLAARYANAAAGVVVGKAGTAVVQPHELLQALSPHPGDKVLRRSEVAERCAWWRLQQKSIVFTNGCFDLLHAGHLRLLRQAASHGDVLVIGLNSDASVTRLKGEGRPMITELERAALLAAFADVDAVVTFEGDTPLALIEEIVPDVLVKGADYRLDQVVGRECVEQNGGRVELIELVPERSSTALIDRLVAEKTAESSS
ncbi:MAG: D-glycero-beta-D-manno-heptose 1-phosphate adenylyltransferase, partial [Acidobacteriota bacterium]